MSRRMSARWLDRPDVRVDEAHRVGEDRACAQAVDDVLLAQHPPAQRSGAATAHGRDASQLGVDVGDDALGGVGRGGRARSATRSSSGLSGSWPIALTTGWCRLPPHAGAARRRRAGGPRLIRRRGHDDDDVDLGSSLRSQFAQDAWHRRRSLHGGVAHRDPNARPPRLSDGDDVTAGG